MLKIFKNKFLEEIGLLSISTLFSKALNFFKDLTLASILGPKTYGVWIHIQLILNYSINLPMGFQHLLGREIPYLQAKKDQKKISKLFNYTFFVLLIFYCSFSIIFIQFNGFGISMDNEILVLILLLIFLYCLQGIFSISTRSFQLFHKFSYSSIAYSIILFLLTWFLSTAIGIRGAIIAMIFTSALIVIYWIKILPLDEKLKTFTISKPSNETIKESFNLFSIAILGIITMSLDRLIMITYYDDKSVGIYGLAFLFNQIVFLIINPINQSVIPKLNYEYGMTEEYSKVEKYFKFLSQGMPLITCFIVSMIYCTVEYFIQEFLPDFSEAIILIKISLIGSIFFTISNGIISFLTAIKKQRTILKNQLALFFLQLVLFTAISSRGLELKFISIALTITLIFYSIINYLTFKRQTKSLSTHKNRVTNSSYLVISFVTLLVVIIDQFLLIKNILIEISVKTSLIIALWGAVAMMFNKEFFKKLFLT